MYISVEYVCIHISLQYTHIEIYMHTYTYIEIYMHIHTYIDIYMHINTYIEIYIHKWIFFWN